MNNPSASIPFTDVNPSQWQAIAHAGSHLLIVAGPGTGKTHTLTYRIIHLLDNLPEPERILAITFTNKAAREMGQRLALKIDGPQERVTIGTFHSFCLQMLTQNRMLTKLPAGFRVADAAVIKETAKKLWPEKTKAQREELLVEISRMKSIRFDEDMPDDALDWTFALRREGYVDFDDLLLETLRLFEEQPHILAETRKIFPHIFVDEYQDINPVQHALLKALVGEESRITAIGDPNQAIYGFRGSDVRFFESFSEDFKDAKILSLKDNYRSAKNLLNASSQIMAEARSVFVPELTAQMYKQGRLTIYEAPTEKAEAEYVVHQIERLVGGTSMFSRDSGRVGIEDAAELSFGDIAVLYRLNSQRTALEEALNRSGMPYQINAEKLSDHPEDLINSFRYAAEDDKIDKVSLMTIHAAKGLEFPVIFIVGCEENIIPLNLEGLVSDIEEERRLFYVGMTRAKERLFLLHTQKRMLYGQARSHRPSRFLSDIEDTLKSLDQPTARKRKRKDQDQLKLF